jgi:replicative DNA helicase
VLVEPAGRQPPEDPEAEASLVAALLRTPDRYFEVGGWLTAEHFGTAAPRWTYAAIADLHATSATVDLVTVRAWLEDRGHLARVGGREGLHALVDHAAPSDAVDELAARIVDRAKLRALIATARRIAIEGHGPQAAAGGEAWLAEQVEAVAKIAADGVDGAEIPDGVQLVAALYESWHNPDKRPRLNTGLPDLDRALRGMMPGQMIIVGAHSGRGKSALAANIATHVLLNERLENKPSGVLVFSLEMTGKEYVERMGCALARIDSGLLDDESQRKMTDDEGRRFIRALQQLSTQALRIDERQDMTMRVLGPTP